MYGHTDSMFSGGMFFGGGVLMWIFWLVLLVVVVYVLKDLFSLKARNPSTDEAMEILKQRFARGEIDESEFEQRKKQLLQ
ncbi:MAG: SHOCT domain-containing protein [Gammaproteobacteria bacterium]|nr:SHOCT domain-containing protein [Gammaproteobacteria bacterium]